jgi:peptide deformylase
MSTDPISAEMQAIKIMRINNKGAYTITDMPPYLQASAGMAATGFPSNYNIGIIDESQMDIRKMVNTVAAILPNPVSGVARVSGVGIAARHIDGHNSAFIEFNCPAEHVGKDASIEIYSGKGALVRKLTQKVLGVRNNLSWDERDDRGSAVSAGTYIVELVSIGKHASAPLTIVR